ncbi:HEAT repeat domain-containing protein [Cellulomonas oligotrophica]|uniref:DNA-binding transcriptional MerR regulator n=1 Tax=Cellulomonas oligotrophica TaxID=931536 RepID=A0A7Y9K0G1_9CELL|nr:HEAT repeat domain-containing protein [Cellulomonas oligotrophica]NYD87844.1 DNA-binding transcriptional MerR regulator [Cellulomonas oligotrophica]GIG32949.1 MerR family transcriptional regulator [Cellulomonas oligotrophica]
MLIGEVSARTGISTRMLRHYDTIGLVRPGGRTGGGYRQYVPSDLRRLFHVEGLRSLGLSLPEVATVLADLEFDPAPMVERLVERTRERLAREEELLQLLTRVRSSGPAAWSEALSTVALLRGLEADDPSARQRLVLALTGETGTGVGPLTEAALREPEPNVAGALYWSLARQGDDAVDELAQALTSTDADRRRRAVAALAKIASPRALTALAAAAGHPDPFVDARATLARGALGDVDAVPALVALVADGRDDVEAADVLGRLAVQPGPAAGVVRAIGAAAADAPAEARRRLTGALAEIPGPEADDALTVLAADPARAVALTATALLRARPASGPDGLPTVSAARQARSSARARARGPGPAGPLRG